MEPYPLLMNPLLKHRPWGGRELARYGKRLPAGTLIGESWEVADLPAEIEDGRSTIANGPYTGKTLRSVIETDRSAILGTARPAPDGGFPLLVKLLDARRNLSVQVHPTAEYVWHPECHLKSEAWIVLEAEPGAVIYKGVRPDVDAETFADHAGSGGIVDDLISVPVTRGDCHYLPSGTCHALGAGVIVAEVQTPSDTTFRVYDWERTDRELHLEQALQCITFGAGSAEEAPLPHPIEVNGKQTVTLVETEYFTIERINALDDTTLEVITEDQPVIWMTLGGTVRITASDVVLEAVRGSTVLMPAMLADATARFSADAEVLRVTLPPPTHGALA